MQTEVRTITPQMAEEFLRRSNEVGGLNRLKRSRISKLKREMEAGRWLLNGQPIIIATSGKVLDGHHRLTAAIDAQAAFKTILVTEADEKALGTIDLGATRNIAETLHLGGHQGKLGPLGALGKAAAWIINHELYGSPFRESPPAYMVEEWLRKHQDLEQPCMDWVETVSTAFDGVKIPKAIVAFAFLAGVVNNQRQATEEFLQKFSTGYNIPDGDPAGVLRNFFLVDYPRLMNSRNRKQKPTPYTILGRTLKCLRLSIDGTKITEKLTFTAKDMLPDLRQAGAEETSTTTVAATSMQSSTTIPSSALALVEHIEAAEASF